MDLNMSVSRFASPITKIDQNDQLYFMSKNGTELLATKSIERVK